MIKIRKSTDTFSMPQALDSKRKIVYVYYDELINSQHSDTAD